MSHYGYQYKQQWYIPSGMACATPSFSQCPKPCVVTCTSGPPKGAELCASRSTAQSSPRCTASCVETRVVEDRSARSSLLADTCGARCPIPCGLQCPQLHVQGWEPLGVPQCGRLCPAPCATGCTTAFPGQHCSYPYSYEWSKSYSYGSGPC